MPNRHVRDQLIHHALKMVMLPNLEVHDMPDGVVLPHALSLVWLQDIIDFWYHMVPFSSTVVNVGLNCTANSDSLTLPSDFILDVRNGYTVQTIPGDSDSFQRAVRVPFQKFLNRSLARQRSSGVKYPLFYCIQGMVGSNQLMKVTPTPNINTVGELWYYQLPAALEAHQKPRFPNDYVITEYIRLRALEWANVIQPGTAQKFCSTIVATMKSAGLMNEPEDDEIPFDTLTFRPSDSYRNTYTWMGER